MDFRTLRFAPIRDAGSLGAALKRYRRTAGVSQATLADRLGTFRPNISRIENGHVVEQLDLILAIIRELGLELHLAGAGDGPVDR